MAGLLGKKNPFRPEAGSLAFYSLKSIDEFEHRRQTSFSMLPLRNDLLRRFLERNSFLNPITRVSFEYRLKKDSKKDSIFDSVKYGDWVEFTCQALDLFGSIFDIYLRIFPIVSYQDDSIFIDFYFENEFQSELSKELLHNFAQASFGVQLVPGTAFGIELSERVICHGISYPNSQNFFDSLPVNNISFYGLFDLEKRVALRHYSFFYRSEPGEKIPQSSCGLVYSLKTFFLNASVLDGHSLASLKT